MARVSSYIGTNIIKRGPTCNSSWISSKKSLFNISRVSIGNLYVYLYLYCLIMVIFPTAGPSHIEGLIVRLCLLLGFILCRLPYRDQLWVKGCVGASSEKCTQHCIGLVSVKYLR